MKKNIDILIVEDSLTQDEKLRFILESNNYNVQHICESVKKALAGQEVRTLENINDFYFDTLYQPVFNENKKISGLVGVAIDVTRQKHSEAKLAESEDKFRNVFETKTEK